MTEVKKTAAAKPAVAAAPAKPKGATPVKAIHAITYGQQKRVEPGEFFVPTSEAELAELVKLGAVDELNDAELALYEKIEASKKDLDPADDLG